MTIISSKDEILWLPHLADGSGPRESTTPLRSPRQVLNDARLLEIVAGGTGKFGVLRLAKLEDV
eukprot:CAMPEP_0185822450 /NCGR_PEP_ID=MMETSP1322-20130828/26768_1 /TAXON_ID=265543 /ORGANISM="Minutocellus polymorphus, Strain RCC2270" /LENGTH=63 /DNA_ID=CAMNT_0028519915 /DNA_START=78 /DNA_END=266 /DNA_ORIENTATION=-